eukprot:gene7880-8692_t
MKDRPGCWLLLLLLPWLLLTACWTQSNARDLEGRESLALSLALKSSSALPPPSSEEITALRDLYYATNGYNWTWLYPLSTYGNKWDFSTEVVNPCDDWQGVTCQNGSAGSFVRKLELVSYNLTGSLPPGMANLTNLLELVLDYNNLQGYIPAGLCSLSNLTQLQIRYNELSGTIPACLHQNLTQLVEISFHKNQLEGSLPSFGSLPKLVYISYSSNYFTGPVPNTTGLVNLRSLYLSSNSFYGSIDNLCLPSLFILALSRNLFHEPLPSCLTRLNKLAYFYLQQNQFYGNISLMTSLTAVQYLLGFENSFTGPLPWACNQWTKLVIFSLDTNFLMGTLPDNVGSWKELQQLTIYSNFFSGSLPASLSTLPVLNLVLINDNILSGPIDQAFNVTTQTNLQIVNIALNPFDGDIPQTMFGPSLLYFTAYHNCFEGSIPDALCKAVELKSLILDDLNAWCAKPIWPSIDGGPTYSKKLSSGIPYCIWSNMANLSTLHLSGNGLTGKIPDLDRYGNLSDLDLSYNSMSGSIPSTLQEWTLLTNLNLANNKFVGLIEDIGDLHYSYNGDQPNTVSLTLNTNRLSGIVPLEISRAYKIDIVEGNIFSCSNDHQPPVHDPNRNSFVCGSNLVDISLYCMYVMLAMLAIAFSVAIYSVYVIQHRKLGMKMEGISVYRKVVMMATVLWNNRFEEMYEMLGNLDDQSSDSLERLMCFCITVFLWRAKMSEIVEEAQHFPALTNLAQFSISMHALSRLSVTLMALTILIGLPLYAGLKVYYRTYTLQYRWELSGVFLSGAHPAIAVILLWCILISWTLFAIVRSIPVSSGSDSMTAWLNRWKSSSLWISFSIIFINLLVVLSIKAGIVYLLVSFNSIFTVKVLLELSLGAIDVLWTAVLVPSMINRLPGLSSMSRMFLKCSVLFLNSICISALAVMAVDTQCFFDIFNVQSSSTESEEFSYCAFYALGTTNCTGGYSTFYTTASYTPQFIYNYNCYSTVITNYVPIFFISYIFLSFAVPLGSMFIIWGRKNKHLQSLQIFYPLILYVDSDYRDQSTTELGDAAGDHSHPKDHNDDNGHVSSLHSPSTKKESADSSFLSLNDLQKTVRAERDIQRSGTSSESSSRPYKRLLFPAFILASAVHHILIQLTFGIFYPALGVVAAVLVCIATFTWEVLMGRWLMRAATPSTIHLSHSSLVNPDTIQLNDVCKKVGLAPRRCLFLLALGSGIFVGMATLDMAGDQLGWEASIWAPISTIVIAIFLVIIFDRFQLPENYFFTEAREKYDVELLSRIPGINLARSSLSLASLMSRWTSAKVTSESDLKASASVDSSTESVENPLSNDIGLSIS